jgi:hypothetical protein
MDSREIPAAAARVTAPGQPYELIDAVVDGEPGYPAFASGTIDTRGPRDGAIAVTNEGDRRA